MKLFFKEGYRFWVVIILFGYSCQNNSNSAAKKRYQDSITSCHNNIPSRFGQVKSDSTENS